MTLPLVLVHGWGVNTAIWNALIPELEPEFEVHLIELPGYGDSPPTQPEMSLSEITDNVLSQAPDRAVWAGWSLGGTIALNAALTHPERIKKLQLISTTPPFSNRLRLGTWHSKRSVRQTCHQFPRGLYQSPAVVFATPTLQNGSS